MKILVTGHRGYVGTVLAPLLKRQGHFLVGLDADWYSGSALFNQPDAADHWISKDIRDAELADFAGVDAVIHLAGLSNDPLGDLDPGLTFEINADAAIRVAKLARQAGVKRFLGTSSCSVYGAAGDRWITEDSTPAPVTAYAKSKLMMEKGVMALGTDRFEVVIARPGTVFGVSPMLRFDLVLNNLVAWALATGAVQFKSDGSAWRPLLHVGDLAAALAFLVTAPAIVVAGQVFNIGFNEQNHRVRDLGPMIQSALPEARIELGSGAGPDPRSYRVDCRLLASRRPSAQPAVGFSSGIRQLVRCLQQFPVNVADFEGPRFQRVARLKTAMEQGLLDHRLRHSQRPDA